MDWTSRIGSQFKPTSSTTRLVSVTMVTAVICILYAEDIQKLTKLERLILSNNLLRHLPKGICALRELQVLDLDGNRLESLVSEISYLRSLKRLNVQSNRITYLPRGLG